MLMGMVNPVSLVPSLWQITPRMRFEGPRTPSLSRTPVSLRLASPPPVSTATGRSWSPASLREMSSPTTPIARIFPMTELTAKSSLTKKLMVDQPPSRKHLLSVWQSDSGARSRRSRRSRRWRRWRRCRWGSVIMVIWSHSCVWLTDTPSVTTCYYRL